MHSLNMLRNSQSRGDQILNARSFEKSGYSKVIEEEELTSESLLDAVKYVSDNRDSYIAKMSGNKEQDSISIITGIIDSLVK